MQFFKFLFLLNLTVSSVFAAKRFVFRHDDFEDYYHNTVQAQLLNWFLDNNVGVGAGIIGDNVGGTDDVIMTVLRRCVAVGDVKCNLWNHNSDHNFLFATATSVSQAQAQVAAGDQKIRSLFPGYVPFMMAPPQNSWNNYLIQALANLGYKIVSASTLDYSGMTWDLTKNPMQMPQQTQTGDWDTAKNDFVAVAPSQTIADCEAAAAAGQVCVIMTHPHEFANGAYTFTMLNQLVQGLYAAGFTSTTFYNIMNENLGLTASPTATPTKAPTRVPTTTPTRAPTRSPTAVPTRNPTAVPTAAITRVPTASPTRNPTVAPSVPLTKAPTTAPTVVTTSAPTIATTTAPTVAVTTAPTIIASTTPTTAPTNAVTASPTIVPTTSPTTAPTDAVTAAPTVATTAAPSITQTTVPTAAPTDAVTTTPTITVTSAPSAAPTVAVTTAPTIGVTAAPTATVAVTTAPSTIPTTVPTVGTTTKPSTSPTVSPTATASVVISTNSRCGPGYGNAVCGASTEPCCSQYGWCGATTAHCAVGCQGAYGACNAIPTTAPTVAPTMAPTFSNSLKVTAELKVKGTSSGQFSAARRTALLNTIKYFETGQNLIGATYSGVTLVVSSTEFNVAVSMTFGLNNVNDAPAVLATTTALLSSALATSQFTDVYRTFTSDSKSVFSFVQVTQNAVNVVGGFEGSTSSSSQSQLSAKEIGVIAGGGFLVLALVSAAAYYFYQRRLRKMDENERIKSFRTESSEELMEGHYSLPKSDHSSVEFVETNMILRHGMKLGEEEGAVPDVVASAHSSRRASREGSLVDIDLSPV